MEFRLTPYDVASILFLFHLLMLLGLVFYLFASSRSENARVSSYYAFEDFFKRILVVFLLFSLFFILLDLLTKYTSYKVLDYWHILWGQVLQETKTSTEPNAIIPPK